MYHNENQELNMNLKMKIFVLIDKLCILYVITCYCTPETPLQGASFLSRLMLRL